MALARRLAVIMHRIWVDGNEFRWTREQAMAADSMQMLVSLTDTSNPPKWSMLRFSF